jgi:ABC-type Fe2+-enterobactin transport system substrate-binding protein
MHGLVYVVLLSFGACRLHSLDITKLEYEDCQSIFGAIVSMLVDLSIGGASAGSMQLDAIVPRILVNVDESGWQQQQQQQQQQRFS